MPYITRPTLARYPLPGQLMLVTHLDRILSNAQSTLHDAITGWALGLPPVRWSGGMPPLLFTIWLALTLPLQRPNQCFRTAWLDWVPLLGPWNTILPVHGQKNTGNGHRSATAPALPSLSLAGLSSAGSPINIYDDNTLGSFIFGTWYTHIDYYTDLITDIITCLFWIPVI